MSFDSFVPTLSPFGPTFGCSFSHLPWCSIVIKILLLRCRRLLEGGEEEVGVELLDVEFGLFAGTGPYHGSAFVVDFEHVALGFLF